jgi:hypothetical protein
MFERIKKYFENIKEIDAIKAQAYAKGQEDASARFLSQQKSMTVKIEELTRQNNETEHRVRSTADERIVMTEKLYDEKCKLCRQNLEEERQRLIRRQNQLAKKMSEFENVWMTMYTHANALIDEHSVLLRSSSRLVASKNILIGFKKQADAIMQDSAPLLSIEMHDSSEDKSIDTPKSELYYVEDVSSKKIAIAEGISKS